MVEPSLTLSSKVYPHERTMVRKLEGESVLLQLGTNAYHGLDDVGTRFWELLLEHAELSRVVDAVVAEFDVAREVAEVDLLRLVSELSARSLVTVE